MGDSALEVLVGLKTARPHRLLRGRINQKTSKTQLTAGWGGWDLFAFYSSPVSRGLL